MGALSDTRAAVMAVVQQIQTDFTAYSLKVESENRTSIDQGTQVNPYLKVEIKPISGDQASLGVNPLVEQRGQILLYACIKDGEGAALADTLRDFVIPYFDRKVLNFVQCYAAIATQPKEVLGWRHFPVIVNYYYHRIAA